MTQQQREQLVDGVDLKAIEDYIYSTMNHTPEWKRAEQAYQNILTARSRPHTPAPAAPVDFTCWRGDCKLHDDCIHSYGQEYPPCVDAAVQQVAHTATLAVLDKLFNDRTIQSGRTDGFEFYIVGVKTVESLRQQEQQ
jgi:hypothetical protein